MKRIAIIPARGGSKRLRKKNLLSLAGKPLVEYTIEAAQKTKLFNKIVVLTDDPEITSLAQSLGVEPYPEPKEYASDKATVLDAFLEYMETSEKNGEKYDIICQMLPTCLFRKPDQIIAGMKLLNKKVDSVIAVSPYEFPITKSLRKKGDNITPYWKNSPLLTGKTRSQDQEVFYHDNGAFYITWWRSMKKNKNFYAGKVKGYEIHPLNAVDIDDKIDFIKAQLLLDFMKTDPDNPLKKWLSHIS